MKKIFIFIIAAIMMLSLSPVSYGADKEIKIGILFSMTGTFAPAGALAGHRGSMVAIDMVNDRGGVSGEYRIKPVVSDAQSKPDIAIREAERLISIEKVPIISGVFSSSIAVPLAPICEKNKTIFWVVIAISDKVVKDRHLDYVFRPQPPGSKWGRSSVELVKEDYAKFGYKSPAQIKVAILHEDGPYGVSVSRASLAGAKKYGMKVVVDEAYTHTTKDLSSVILKLKRAKPDVILHTGYFPDVVLFFRQARELGLKWKALIGHGAGYAHFGTLEKSLKRKMVNYVCNVDPAPAQILDRTTLKADTGDIITEFLKRYKEKYGVDNPPSHATMGFGHTWILLNNVFPLALKKQGKITPDTIREASLELRIPEGATPCGYGVEFAPPEHEYSGQNLKSYPVVTQWVDGEVKIVWPSGLKTLDAKIPWPADSPFAVK